MAAKTISTTSSTKGLRALPTALTQLTAGYLPASSIASLARTGRQESKDVKSYLDRMKACYDSAYGGLLCDDKKWSESNPQCQTWCAGLSPRKREEKVWTFVQRFHELDPILRAGTPYEERKFNEIVTYKKKTLEEEKKKRLEEEKKNREARERERKLMDEWRALPNPVKRAMINLWDQRIAQVWNRLEEWNPEYKEGAERDLASWVVYYGPEAIEAVLRNPQAEFERTPNRYWARWNPTNHEERLWWNAEDNPIWQLSVENVPEN